MDNLKTFEQFTTEYDGNLNEALSEKDNMKKIIKSFIPHIVKTNISEIEKLGFDKNSNFKGILNQGVADKLTDEKEIALYNIFKGQAGKMVKQSEKAVKSGHEKGRTV